MKLHARFPTRLRGHELEAEIAGEFDPPLVSLKISFFKNGVHFPVFNLSREELTKLMRQAADSKKRAKH
jgi:hypothetical protein